VDVRAPRTTYVYPPAPKNRRSLDYRWGKAQDRAESYLPSMPMRSAWPWFPDATVYEIARAD
jgi:hypothetical protein